MQAAEHASQIASHALEDAMQQGNAPKVRCVPAVPTRQLLQVEALV